MGLAKFFKSIGSKKDRDSVVDSPVFKDNWGIVMVRVGMYSGFVVPYANVVWTTAHLPFLFYTAYHCIALDFDFGLFCSTCHYILMMTSVCTSIVNCQVNSHHFEAMVRLLEMDVYKYKDTIDPLTEEIMATEKDTMAKRKKSYSTVMFWLFMAAAGISMIFFPILFKIPDTGEKIDYIHRDLPVVVWYPIDKYSWSGYLWLLFTEYWIAFVIIMVVAGTDITFLCYAEEGVYHLKAVGLTLRYVLRRARFLYKKRYGGDDISHKDPKFHACLKVCLKQSIQHHYEILKYFNHLDRLYFFILLVIVLSSTFMLCISGILFVAENVDMKPKLQFFCYLITLILHTFTFSWYGEIIANTSMDLSGDLYESEWEDCSDVVRRYLLIMQAYVGQPVIISAGGFMAVNLNTFGNVLSSSYSYFNLLSVMMARGNDGN
uniref:Odorant receptor n=1 Tax=Yemma signatus TaxID=300820 RepID=A0A385H5X8_9HEMI|nr:odorant receptor [Yemma signatus]